jgi:hypothetical protein
MSKEKLKFSKGGEQNYITEIFKIRKGMHKTPRPVYELEDLLGTHVEGHLYYEELIPVRISKRTNYKIDKIFKKIVRGGIPEYLVRWRGYNSFIDSCIPGSSVKPIEDGNSQRSKQLQRHAETIYL